MPLLKGSTPPDAFASKQSLSLVSWRGALIAIAVAFIAQWPALLANGPLAFSDTTSYHAAGHEAAMFATKLAAPVLDLATFGGADGASQAEEPGAGRPGLGDGPGALRSITFAVYMFVAGSTLGHALIALPLAAAALFVLFSLSTAGASIRPLDGAVAASLCAAMTTLPWFAVYAMPDILAAAVILYGAALVRAVDRLSALECLALAAIAAFAILCHYGNIALALGMVGVVLLLRAAQSRLSLRAVALGVGPIAAAITINAGLSATAFGEASIAPKRWPILLARSIDDGPARWHLEEHCDARGYAICGSFETIPDDFLEVLWSEKGLVSADEELLHRIRDEEFTILWRAFLEYPFAQISSLAANSVQQFATVGLDDHFSAHLKVTRWGDSVLAPDPDPRIIEPIRNNFDWLLKASLIASMIALALFSLFGRLTAREAEVIAVVFAGLALNAAIFGGLAIPSDRFQGRVAWVLPAVLCLLVLDRRAAAARRRGDPSETVARLAKLRESATRETIIQRSVEQRRSAEQRRPEDAKPRAD